MTSVNAKYKRLCGSSEMGDDVPGNLVRFQVVFWLTSNTNASYLHVSTVKVRRLPFIAAHERNKGDNLTFSSFSPSQIAAFAGSKRQVQSNHRYCCYAFGLASGLCAKRAKSSWASCLHEHPESGGVSGL